MNAKSYPLIRLRVHVASYSWIWSSLGIYTIFILFLQLSENKCSFGSFSMWYQEPLGNQCSQGHEILIAEFHKQEITVANVQPQTSQWWTHTKYVANIAAITQMWIALVISQYIRFVQTLLFQQSNNACLSSNLEERCEPHIATSFKVQKAAYSKA